MHADFRGEVLRAAPETVQVAGVGVEQGVNLFPVAKMEIPLVLLFSLRNENGPAHREVKFVLAA